MGIGDWKKRKTLEVGYVLTGGRKAGDNVSSKEPRESQMQIHDIFLWNRVMQVKSHQILILLKEVWGWGMILQKKKRKKENLFTQQTAKAIKY